MEGREDFIAATDPDAFADMITLNLRDGSLGDFTGGTALVEEQRADDEGIAVGDTLTLRLPKGEQDVDVAGIYEQNPAVGVPYLFTLDEFVSGGLRPLRWWGFWLRCCRRDGPLASTCSPPSAPSSAPTQSVIRAFRQSWLGGLARVRRQRRTRRRRS
ncbi:MAG: hypothetical protein M3529_05005 [Actinomycetota bacterium]|nr:hypothetical protein [Actinomycetota bacterium]